MRLHLLCLLFMLLPTVFTVAQTGIDVTNELGTNQSSTFSEEQPLISGDGSVLYFVRRDHPQNMGGLDDHDDIWLTEKKSGNQWQRPLHLSGPLNNRRNNRVVGISADAAVLYLGSWSLSYKQHQIWKAQKQGRLWSTPQPISFTEPLDFQELEICHVTTDGKYLFLAGVRDDGYGGYDLYVCAQEENGRWGRPLNLGATINSENDEFSAFLASDGSTLYFSSNGHRSIGGQDIFLSRKTGDEWQAWQSPTNLGNEINSPKNEVYPSVAASGNKLYYSSTVASNTQRIYSKSLPFRNQPEAVILLKGSIEDEAKNYPASADVFIHYPTSEMPFQRLTVRGGKFEQVIPFRDEMILYTKVDRYFSISQRIAIDNNVINELDGSRVDNAVASTTVKGGYADVERLQLQLRKTDKEIAQLKRAEREIEQRIARQDNDSNLAWSRNYRTDPELESLKHEYNSWIKEYQTNPEEEKLQSKGKAVVSSDEDDELMALRRKFNRHYNAEPTEKKQAPKVAISGAAKEAEFPHFESIQQQITRELEQELMSEVQVELLNDIFPSVTQQFSKSLNKEQRSLLTSKMRSSVRQKLKMTYQQKSTNLSDQTNQLTKDNPAELKQVEKDLRKNLYDKVKIDMKKSVEATVRRDIRQGLTYQLKQQRKEKMEAELQALIEKHTAEDQSVNRATEPQLATKGTIDFSDSKAVKAFREIIVNLKLKAIRPGQVIPLNNIRFLPDQATLFPASQIELDQLLHFMQSNAGLIVEIGSHTNGLCQYDIADTLTAQRAEVIAAYLTTNGIDRQRIQAVGYGKQQPLVSNDTVEGRRKNQRIEIKILNY